MVSYTGGGSSPAGGSGNIATAVNLPALATGTLSNTATVLPPAGVTDPDLSNNTSTATDEIGGVIDLTATKIGDDTYKGGGFLNFTVVVTCRSARSSAFPAATGTGR